MKTMQKIGAFALALLLVLSLGATAFAAGEDANTNFNKTVTIDGLEANEVVTAYKLFGYAESYNSYEIDANFAAYLATLSGNAKDPAKWSTGNVNVATLLEGYVTACSNKDESNITLPTQKQDVTATGESVEFTFEPGYYMVLVATTLTNGKVYRPLSVFVKVTGEKSEVYGGGSNTALEPATLTAKSERAPELVKQVKELGTDAASWRTAEDAAVGETVEFYLKVTIPHYADVSDVLLRVEDQLTNLSYNNDAVLYDAVPGGNGAQKIENALTTAVGENGKLTFTLDYKTLTDGNTDRTVYIYYTANVTADAVVDDNHSAKNIAKLYYGNKATPDVVLETNEVSTDVYNYAFSLNKFTYSAATESYQSLEGAEFTVYTDAACNNAISFVKVGTYYRPATAGEAGSVTAIPAADILNPADGSTGFKLRGLDAGTYYVKETKTPKGYAAPAGAYTMIIQAETDNGVITGNIDHNNKDYIKASFVSSIGDNGDESLVIQRVCRQNNKDESYDTLHIVFDNSVMPVLPSTGGMGTAIFTVGGVAVMVLAAVLLLFRRKKQEE